MEEYSMKSTLRNNLLRKQTNERITRHNRRAYPMRLLCARLDQIRIAKPIDGSNGLFTRRASHGLT